MTKKDTNHRNEKIWIGVDVAKSAVDVGDGERTEQVARQPHALAAWAARLPEAAHVVVEATGGYERQVVEAVLRAGRRVSVVNPRQARDFARAIGQLAKTDKLDAHVLAHFGRAIEPQELQVRSHEEEELRALLDRRRQIVETRTSEKNRRKQAHPAIQSSIDEHIQWLEERVEALDRQIESLKAKHEAIAESCRCLESAPGVGPVVACTLVAHLPELGRVSRQQIAGLVGLAPYANDSGCVHRRRTIWGGRAEVRSMLYMAAHSAVRSSTPLRQFFERLLARGKTKKAAYAAVARKLLTHLNAMMRNSRPYSAEPSCC